jgi:hypothetical protein
MSEKVDCGNHEALIEYLYDEGSPAERAGMAAHLAMCARCAGEIASLREARGTLASWTPPVAQLGFRIVSDAQPASAPPPGRWHWPGVPAWAQAVAAVLIFGTGLGLGALRGVATPPASGPEAAAVSPQDLAALEQRIRGEVQREVQQLRAAATAPAAASAQAAPMTSSITMQQVRALIAESEQRQQRELTLRTAEVIRDFDAQRRGDLVRIQQTFGRLEGTMGAEVAQQNQRLNLLMRVAQPGQ